jgi:hypothetical protein
LCVALGLLAGLGVYPFLVGFAGICGFSSDFEGLWFAVELFFFCFLTYFEMTYAVEFAEFLLAAISAVWLKTMYQGIKISLLKSKVTPPVLLSVQVMRTDDGF